MFNELINLNDAPIPFETVNLWQGGHSLKHKGHDFPWSVTQKEYDFLHSIIVDNNLKNGIDLCTGIGISALSAAMAMKKTGGKLVTIDAYVEEYFNHFTYKSKKIIYDSDGYKNIIYLRDKFNLQKELIAEIGWSPDDVPTIIERNFDEMLDFVFIDGGHTEEQLFKDISCILPYTNENTFWLFHDCIDALWTKKIQDFCFEKMNSILRIQCPISEGNHNLGQLFRLKG
jgi:hypothetical protein